MKITIYGTDTHGTIKVITDGKTYEITSAKSLKSQTTVDKEPVPVVGTAPTESNCGPEQVDINKASLDDIMRIKHLGEVRGKELISLRSFQSIDQLTRIKGIACRSSGGY